MSKELKYSWNLCVPGYWKTKEGHVLQTIDRPAKRSHAWYKFRNHEFEVRGSFQAQLKAEELIKSDLETFKKALEKAEHIRIGGRGMSHNIDDLLEEIEILKGYKIMYQNLSEQNKRYREAIKFGIEYLKNSDIRQVQLVVRALKKALEGEE